MIKIIVITMLIIILIMIIKRNLEVVNQQRTLCVPKKKKTKLFNLYLCFFYRFLRSSIFTFVLFFLGVAIRLYIYIYIHIALLLCIEHCFTKVKFIYICAISAYVYQIVSRGCMLTTHTLHMRAVILRVYSFV